MKRCTKCLIMKPNSEFHRNKSTKTGYTSACKNCVSLAKRVYRENNKEKIRQKNKEYRENNKERITRRQKENADYYRAYSKNYIKNRRRNDPKFYMINILRNRLRLALKNKAKKGSAVRDLGMPIDAFLVYLNLDCIDRYGESYTGNEKKYHIDHIRPLSSFNLNDPSELKAAIHWSNLQVLEAKENIKKGGRLF